MTATPFVKCSTGRTRSHCSRLTLTHCRYDSDSSGIRLHADEAAVNVNIWLTPDYSNLDPGSGGLVVFNTAAPDMDDFDAFNHNDFEEERQAYATGHATRVLNTPYRANRAVVFDSALLHATDTFRFRKGLRHRRINLTLLYGDAAVPA